MSRDRKIAVVVPLLSAALALGSCAWALSIRDEATQIHNEDLQALHHKDCREIP